MWTTTPLKIKTSGNIKGKNRVSIRWTSGKKKVDKKVEEKWNCGEKEINFKKKNK